MLKIESVSIIFTIWSKQKMLEIGNILIYERSYKDLVIYFTSYIHSKSINLLRPYYQKLIRKNQKREWKKMMAWDQDIVHIKWIKFIDFMICFFVEMAYIRNCDV